MEEKKRVGRGVAKESHAEYLTNRTWITNELNGIYTHLPKRLQTHNYGLEFRNYPVKRVER